MVGVGYKKKMAQSNGRTECLDDLGLRFDVGNKWFGKREGEKFQVSLFPHFLWSFLSSITPAAS